MIKLVGTTGCSRCEMVKTILTNKGIEFEYVLLNELEPSMKALYLLISREAGNMQMPIMIKDNKSISINEV